MNPEHERSTGLLRRASDVFQEHFGAAPERSFQAPGRVNIIGEHTDYNDGFVLPCAIDYQTVVVGRRRTDRRVRVIAADYGADRCEFECVSPIPFDSQSPWSNYVRGVIQVMLDDGMALSGADIVIAGNVPQGAGLSSSASLEVVTAWSMGCLSDVTPDPVAIAQMAQRAENEYVGCSCGIMDQLISAKGEVGHALLIDCRNLETTAVAIPEGSAIVIINSNVRRGLLDSEYNTRRAQCDAAAAHYGVQALRDLDGETLEAKRGDLDEISYRRARHVVTENQRTLAAASALDAGDLAGLGELMGASHVSMRDDFEITVPAIDTIVELVGGVIGPTGGVRMTGGGFGGCVVCIAPSDRVPAIRRVMEMRYPQLTGLTADIYVSRATSGAGVIK